MARLGHVFICLTCVLVGCGSSAVSTGIDATVAVADARAPDVVVSLADATPPDAIATPDSPTTADAPLAVPDATAADAPPTPDAPPGTPDAANPPPDAPPLPPDAAPPDAAPLPPDATPHPDATPSACPLAASTEPSGAQSPSGCAVVDRDTSGCNEARAALGLSGYWLDFSCRVTLSVTTNGGIAVVEAMADGQPDYFSFYFATSNACYETYTGGIHNPNSISAQHHVVDFIRAPNTTSTAMRGAVVGMALNGVPIFGNFAAPGDDIFNEAKTFDRCGAHPQNTGVYHYHGEPYSISYDDSRFIGVMRDGYPIYGRRDSDGSLPTLDSYGGHTGTTPHSPSSAVYHYHVSLQTSTTSGTAGQMQWFLTTGNYRGTPVPCATCN